MWYPFKDFVDVIQEKDAEYESQVGSKIPKIDCNISSSSDCDQIQQPQPQSQSDDEDFILMPWYSVTGPTKMPKDPVARTLMRLLWFLT